MTAMACLGNHGPWGWDTSTASHVTSEQHCEMDIIVHSLHKMHQGPQSWADSSPGPVTLNPALLPLKHAILYTSSSSCWANRIWNQIHDLWHARPTALLLGTHRLVFQPCDSCHGRSPVLEGRSKPTFSHRQFTGQALPEQLLFIY